MFIFVQFKYRVFIHSKNSQFAPENTIFKLYKLFKEHKDFQNLKSSNFEQNCNYILHY